MGGLYDEKFLVKEYKFHEPLLSEIDFIIDICKKDCYYNFYHTHRDLQQNTILILQVKEIMNSIIYQLLISQ